MALSRVPSNHVARSGALRTENRTRTAPALSARSCFLSVDRYRLSSEEDFFVAISSPSTHHVASLLQPSPADVSTRWW